LPAAFDVVLDLDFRLQPNTLPSLAPALMLAFSLSPWLGYRSFCPETRPAQTERPAPLI
jgi:hypothetical protein